MNNLFDLNKVLFENEYKKPNLSIIDINFNNEIPLGFNPNTIQLPIFRAVFNNDIEVVKEYKNKNYIERNLNHQTPLMLAARLNNFEIVKLLLNECCQIDDDDNVALDFALKYTSNKDLIEVLEEYELYF